jgi:hypothetical protein
MAPASGSKCGERFIKNYTHKKAHLSSILESMKLPSPMISRTGNQWIS